MPTMSARSPAPSRQVRRAASHPPPEATSEVALRLTEADADRGSPMRSPILPRTWLGRVLRYRWRSVRPPLPTSDLPRVPQWPCEHEAAMVQRNRRATPTARPVRTDAERLYYLDTPIAA